MRYNMINFGYNAWGPFWKRNQTIFSYLSREQFINKALFVNPGLWGTRLLLNPGLFANDIFRLRLKGIIPWKNSENIEVFTPLYLPFCGRSPFILNLSEGWAKKVLDKYSNKPFIILINNPSPGMKNLIDYCSKQANLKFFDWSDDFSEFTDDTKIKEEISKTCDHYIKASNLVITINEELTNRAKEFNKNSYTLKNATNYFNYSSESEAVPESLKNLQRPIIGYTGWINKLRLDREIIEHMLSEKPEWSFVFMGPKSQKNPLGENINRFHNIHFISPKPYKEMVAYIKSFDVCILPNLLNRHTSGNDPIKLYDYLASGRPIVSTATEGTKALEKHLLIANDKFEFVKCLEYALQDNRRGIENRRSVALQNSWSMRYEVLKSIITLIIDS